MPEKNKLLKLNRLDFDSPADKREFNRGLFDQVAPTYDFITAWLSFGRDSVWKKIMLMSLPDLEHPNILDLACGTGDITLALANRYSNGQVTGLDLNPTMLELARVRCQHPKISLCQGDMNHTGFDSAQFDVITGGYALRNAPDLAATLAEIYRLLKPGGCCAFLDFSKSPRPWLQWASLMLLKWWGVCWGLVFHGNPDIYAYLAESLKHFPDRAQLKHMLVTAGFQKISSRIFFFGFIELLLFKK